LLFSSFSWWAFERQLAATDEATFVPQLTSTNLQ
jgi:hypothetical protein